MRYALILLSLAVLLLSGCASHEAASLPQLGDELKAQQGKVEDKGMVLIARPIHSKPDLKTYFDQDLVQYGVLPVQFHVCNKSVGCPVVLTPDAITLKNAKGDSIPAMNMEQVMAKAQKGLGQTGGWTMAFGVVGLIASSINVSETNEKMRADYESRLLKGGDLAPGAEIEGLMFYKVPHDLNSLDGWKLTLVVVDPTTIKTTSLVYELAGSVEPRPELVTEPMEQIPQSEDGPS